MQKLVSIRDLREYFKRHDADSFNFLTENQAWYRVSEPCKVSLSFQTMLIYENPNLICLKSGHDNIVFSRVRCVGIDTDTPVLGTVLTIFCGDTCDDWPCTAYTVIATTNNHDNSEKSLDQPLPNRYNGTEAKARRDAYVQHRTENRFHTPIHTQYEHDRSGSASVQFDWSL